MTKVVFEQPFNFETVDLADFFGGTVDIFGATTTQFSIADGKFSAVIKGEDFNPFSLTGTVHEADVLYKNRPLFTATKMNVDLGDVIDNADNDAALREIFFGGADTFKGSKGADVLAAFGGDDVIAGGKGNDVIIGGAGADILSGGVGEDSFVYTDASDSTKKVADLITDLNDGEDHIDLQGLGLESLDQISAVYNEAKDRTAFIVDVNGESTVYITADGDHTSFDNFAI